MADAINSSNQNPIHLGLKADADGSSKLVVSSKTKSTEVSCKVLPEGLRGRIHSTFLQVTGWVPVQHPDFRDRHVQVLIQQSTLINLQNEGLDITNEAFQESGGSKKIPDDVLSKVKAFFQDGKKEEEFLEAVQICIDSGGKKLVLDGLFNAKGECPDIFKDDIFKGLQELSLVGISDLPLTVRFLKKLEMLDLSYSSRFPEFQILQQLSKLKVLNLDYSAINQISRLEERAKGIKGESSIGEIGARLVVNELFDCLKQLTDLKEIGMVSLDRDCLSGDILSAKFKENQQTVDVRTHDEIDLVNDFDDIDDVESKSIGAQQESNSLPPLLEKKIREFFSADKRRADLFIERVQEYIERGKKELVLDGAFNAKGECPDIFNDSLFGSLKELSLQGIKELPPSIRYLKELEGLDLSYSSIVNCPTQIKRLANLSYLNLASSGVTQKEALIKFGKEYCGLYRSNEFYLEKGSEFAAKSWSEGLIPLKNLKQVNMVTGDVVNCHSADLLTEDLRSGGRGDIIILRL